MIVGVILGIASSALFAQRGPGSVPDAVRADPAHYAVSFENELVRSGAVTAMSTFRKTLGQTPQSSSWSSSRIARGSEDKIGPVAQHERDPDRADQTRIKHGSRDEI
jgi:hypothetical protein